MLANLSLLLTAPRSFYKLLTFEVVHIANFIVGQRKHRPSIWVDSGKKYLKKKCPATAWSQNQKKSNQLV